MAEERIGYSIPACRYHGPRFSAVQDRPGFSRGAQGCPGSVKRRASTVPYLTTTLHFTAEKPLPALPVTRKAWAKENGQRTAEKKRCRRWQAGSGSPPLFGSPAVCGVPAVPCRLGEWQRLLLQTLIVGLCH